MSAVFPLSLSVCEHIAGNEKFATKAFALQQRMLDAQGGPLFDITIDLEDGATVGDEARLRTALLDLITSDLNRFQRCGIRMYSRTNPHFVDGLEEIAARAGSILSYLTIPKVVSYQDFTSTAEVISEIFDRHVPGRKVPLHVLIETHEALADVDRIAAHPDVEALDFGIMDFISEHNGLIPAENMESPGQFEHVLVVRAKIALAAAAARFGKTATHSVTINVRDPNQARLDAELAWRKFGFSRMWSIHPEQIEAILDGFRPNQKEKELASKVLDKGKTALWGPIELDGKLYDRASYRYYAGLLRRALPWSPS